MRIEQQKGRNSSHAFYVIIQKIACQDWVCAKHTFESHGWDLFNNCSVAWCHYV